MTLGRPSRKIIEMPLSVSAPRDSFKFKLHCKNSGHDYAYDYTDMGGRYPSIVNAFITAIIALRNTIGHRRRLRVKISLNDFIAYLDTRIGTPGEIAEFRQLDSVVFSNYAAWQRLYGTGSSLSKAHRLTTLQPFVRWLSKNHPDAHDDLAIDRNLFPSAHRSVVARKPYSISEWNDLLKALAVEIQNSKSRLETPYQAVWLGKTAPLEDVAPFDESKPAHVQHAPWDSDQRLIWWWENTTNCCRVNDYSIRNFPKASSVLDAIYRKAKKGHWGPLVAGKSFLNHFYDSIGAGPGYVPQFLGKPDPIRYCNRFRKPEFLHWYWENVLEARIIGRAKLVAEGRYAFALGATAVFGSVEKFYEYIGLNYKIQYRDLMPYFLLLAVRTALNFATIARLTVDCIRPAPGVSEADINEPDQWQIDWEKIRAFSQGSTIPSHIRHELMPVSIILRVTQITERIRLDQKQLWLSDRGVSLQDMRVPILEFVERHHLIMRDSNGEIFPFKLDISRIRPTVAMQEYIRTENMGYIQSLLGHARMGTSVQYISQMNDPILLSRRGAHQDAMFLSLTGDNSGAISVLESHGLCRHLPKEEMATPPEVLDLIGNDTENEVCLSCQNLVVTNHDLHKYFSFLQYHDALLMDGSLSEDDYHKTIDEVREIFETFVLPKFSPAMVSVARETAGSRPVNEWVRGEITS